MIPEEGVGNPGQVGFISLVAVHQEAEKWGQLRIPGKAGSRSLMVLAQDPWRAGPSCRMGATSNHTRGVSSIEARPCFLRRRHTA